MEIETAQKPLTIRHFMNKSIPITLILLGMYCPHSIAMISLVQRAGQKLVQTSAVTKATRTALSLSFLSWSLFAKSTKQPEPILQLEETKFKPITKIYPAFDGEITETYKDGAPEAGGQVVYKSSSTEQRKYDISFKAIMNFNGPTKDYHIEDQPDVQNSQQRKDYNKRLETFKYYLGLRCWSVCPVINKTNEPCEHTRTYPHPLISNGHIPYTSCNGGLLNPVLKEYRVTAANNSDAKRRIATVIVEGVVSADGLDFQKLNATSIGKAYGNVANDPSALELAIAGHLKERTVDRQLSDITDAYFEDYVVHPYAEKFKKCVEAEWSSNLSATDNGMRSVECEDLIKRHFPRKAYWPSRWGNPKGMRIGYRDVHQHTFQSPKEPDDASMQMTFDVVVKNTSNEQ